MVMHHPQKVFVIVVTSLLVAACSTSPEAKVRQMEEKAEALKESSGYNECMRKVGADNLKLEQCYKAKLEAAGYTDGIDCIQNFETPPCTNRERYNAEVEAHNTCPDEVEYETELTEFDCAQLLMEARI